MKLQTDAVQEGLLFFSFYELAEGVRRGLL